ncbi:alkaline phosphatase family protein [Gordonia alkanivorans]|uniref:alkaline phosphatase family protein n=1 Tax=Gordonia alkanivorans TaxID=84096 RepID=UPI001F4EB7C2|nr:nucleotide pyrophosphatase/phosphodiesterase family protein [Gordonia alkanivorans]MDH3010935.1 alkaline phosphatase family protein [Gordonia alkanivorans]MDH3052462.1 alkaline phosphatase family protein [Gordonia alkanivorans]MDJ0008513.1 alkaline phosphatase family protein [Gordonia alkanivorans]MDJ0098531.1 alkaline phosphatase family protein [Gordonia alkanivorans]MDJ0494088.1 alkaline phosphatase family protein [Gordonia alkanivorans]
MSGELTPDELTPADWGRYPHTLADVLPAASVALSVSDSADLVVPPGDSVVVLLIDGLGATLLEEYAEFAPTLRELTATTLRAGFPATTATSILSLTVGAPCGVHGIIGYSFRPDDDCRTRGSRRVLNSLRWSLDDAQGPSALVTYPPALVRTHPGSLETLADKGVRVTYVMPGEFRGSGLTLAAFRAPGQYVPAVTPDGVRDGVLAAVRGHSRHRRFVYAYYSELDMAGHIHGPGSSAWLEKLRLVDQLVAELAAELPSGTTLLVTGDHGMITADRAIDIDTAPELLEGVDAVAGEARARHVYATPGAADDVLKAWSGHLGDAAHVVSREQTLDEGWFGREVTDAVANRIGDVVAVARESVTLTRSKNETMESMMIGHHGAWTAAEQLVPLLVAQG